MIRNNHRYFLWLYTKKKYRNLYHLGSGLFIWLFLAIAQPFGIYNTNLRFGGLLLFLLVFAIIWPLVSYLVDWIAGWKNSQDQLRFNFFLWFVKIAIMTHSVYGIREYFCPGYCIDLREYGEIWLACSLLFLFTYTPFMLYGRYMYYRSMIGFPGETTGMLTLKGQGKEQITIFINGLIYLQADDNYVDLYLDNTQSFKKEVLRATLGDLEVQLKDHHQFFRIHRSIIVNTKYVLKPHKKGALSVLLEKQQVELPVSRSYQGQVDQLFTHPK